MSRPVACGFTLALAAVVALAAPAEATPVAPVVRLPASVPFACATPLSGTGAPTYYAIELVPTGRVPGTREAGGVADVYFRSGPFTVSVASDGAFAQRVRVAVRGVSERVDDVLAVWVTTHELDRVMRLGTLTGAGEIEGEVAWNKFIVVVSLEASVETLGDRWSGPIVMRGSSRSGRMHTMAGHGPFEGEPCAKYGY